MSMRIRQLECIVVLVIACEVTQTGDIRGDGSSGGSSGAPVTTGTAGEASGEHGSSGQASTSDAGVSPSSTSGATTSDTVNEDAESSTAAGTSGDDPGESGLEAQCRRYFECGGDNYSDIEQCVADALAWWGDCAEVRAALDDFGWCMASVDCSEYDPEAYLPQAFCPKQYDALLKASC
jgi:hypothetical protein